MYIYFKDKELALNALSSSTDKTNLLKRYEDKYRLNVYDLNFKERSKFFYQFCKPNKLDAFQIDNRDSSKCFIFLKSDLEYAISIYREILFKFKDREDVVVCINTQNDAKWLQLFFNSNSETDKERKYIYKTIKEEMDLRYKILSSDGDGEDRC
jgi:hypothetical protein